MTISVLVRQPMAPNMVSLGRLVLDMSAPWQDYCPYFPVQLSPEKDVATTEFLHVHEIIEQTRGTKFHANITQAFSSLSGMTKRSTAHIVAPHGVRYWLLNSGDHFGRVCRDSNVRDWFDRVIKRGFDVYMVVGIVVLRDAKIANTVETTSRVESSIELPVTDAATAGVTSLVPTSLGAILDSGLGAGHLSQNTTETSYFAPGDRIIAVEYRKVRFEWFSSRKAGTAFLEKGNRWIVHHTSSRMEPTDDSEDVVEENLQEVSTKADLDIVYEVYCIGKDGDEFLLLD